MELRLLRYFLAVAEELHFGRAARRLHIAQPPLSQQIRKLERELGVDLFERSKRIVRLTVAGKVFDEHARRVLHEADLAAEATRRAARGEIGSLRIGFISTAIFGVVPATVRTFRAHWPEVALSLHVAASAQQLEALRDARLDIGLVRPPFPDLTTGLLCRVIDREPLVACLPATHRLAEQQTVALTSLAAEGFIWFPRTVGDGLHGALFRVCQEAGFVPSVVCEASEIHGIVGLVAAGIGIALVPRSMKAVSIAGAVYRPLSGSTTTIPLAACWREGDQTPTLAHFLSLLPEI